MVPWGKKTENGLDLYVRYKLTRAKDYLRLANSQSHCVSSVYYYYSSVVWSAFGEISRCDKYRFLSVSHTHTCPFDKFKKLNIHFVDTRFESQAQGWPILMYRSRFFLNNILGNYTRNHNLEPLFLLRSVILEVIT